MFGFVVANPEKLKKSSAEHYREVYCGLCDALGSEHGFLNRLTLTYDLAFLIIVLSAVTGEEYVRTEKHCPVHISKRFFASNRYTSYAASINIALSYYKFIDDKNDDGSLGAGLKAAVFRREALRIAETYPNACKAITDCLERLSAAEKADIMMPDVCAGIFGELMGALFTPDGIAYRDELYAFGDSLGKSIYLMDAAVDLKKDIKHRSYNPLIMMRSEEIKTLLDVFMADTAEKYKKLPISQDGDIIENILYSGIWTVYATRREGKVKNS